MWTKKTTWVGILAIVGGFIEGIFGNWDSGITKIIAGIGMITMRHAIKKGR